MNRVKKTKNDKIVFRVIGNYTIQTITIEDGIRNIHIEYINQD